MKAHFSRTVREQCQCQEHRTCPANPGSPAYRRSLRKTLKVETFFCLDSSHLSMVGAQACFSLSSECLRHGHEVCGEGAVKMHHHKRARNFYKEQVGKGLS